MVSAVDSQIFKVTLLGANPADCGWFTASVNGAQAIRIADIVEGSSNCIDHVDRGLVLLQHVVEMLSTASAAVPLEAVAVDFFNPSCFSGDLGAGAQAENKFKSFKLTKLSHNSVTGLVSMGRQSALELSKG